MIVHAESERERSAQKKVACSWGTENPIKRLNLNCFPLKERRRRRKRRVTGGTGGGALLV